MGYKITILILAVLFPVLVMAQTQVPTSRQEQQIQQQVQQQKAGEWVQKSWEGVEIQSQEEFEKQEKIRCDYKLKHYKKKLTKHPDSEYYKLKLKKWTKRCK